MIYKPDCRFDILQQFGAVLQELSPSELNYSSHSSCINSANSKTVIIITGDFSTDNNLTLLEVQSVFVSIMKMAEVNDKHVHCAMLGDGMVGKTCLTLSYTEKSFTDDYTATVFDNYPGKWLFSL